MFLNVKNTSKLILCNFNNIEKLNQQPIPEPSQPLSCSNRHLFHFFRLCTEEDFQNLPLNTPPEMQRIDLSLAVLQLKALGIDNIVRFEFPSAPPSKNLIACMELLYALGALDDKGNLTKPLGDQMSELPINPVLSKMLFNSGEFGCVKEMAIIVAMLQVSSDSEADFESWVTVHGRG